MSTNDYLIKIEAQGKELDTLRTENAELKAELYNKKTLAELLKDCISRLEKLEGKEISSLKAKNRVLEIELAHYTAANSGLTFKNPPPKSSKTYICKPKTKDN